MVTVEKRKKKIPKKYASSGDSEKRKERKKQKKLITSLSCTRVRLPPGVNDTMAGAKWANHLVAPQDNELISNQAIDLSISNPINARTQAGRLALIIARVGL